MTYKAFQNSYSVENWWTELQKVVYHIIFMINELDQLGVPNVIPLEIYFLFETTFSWNKGIEYLYC